MKAAAKDFLRAAVLKLPWGAREAIFEALSADFGHSQVLARLAAKTGIAGFSAPGRWGAIQSAAGDLSILPVYARTGDWAARTHGAFTDFFADGGGTFLDIGANIGLTTLPVAANPATRCFAFEPEPANFANLIENIHRNAVHGNVTLFQLALFNRPGTVEFGLADDGNLGDHRVVAAGHTRRTIAVQAARLDDLDLPISGRLGVKIDTQGAEPAIIEGGAAVLARASLAAIEFAPFLMDQLGGDPETVLRYLACFDRIAIVPGEADRDLDFVPAATACDTLRAAYHRDRGDIRVYFDVFATRALP